MKKVRNLAFFGVMASILSVAGAYADDNTIIASKAYVDAKDSALNSTLQSATAAIGTNAEADNVLASSGTTKLTKVSAVQAAKSTTATATNSNGTITVQTGDDTHFPTTKAVGSGLTALKTKIDANTTAIGTKQATLADGTNMSVTGSGNAITSISATNGVVTATKGLTFLQAADISGKEDKSNKQGTGKGLITADTDKSIKTIAAGTAGYYQDQQALSEDFSKIKEAIALKANTSALGALASKDTVATADIDDSAVTTAKIANSNVTTAKIADSNVTTAKIANLNVTTDKLAASAVTNAKLATDAVQTTNIKDGNVTTAKIADDAVTTAKIADANVTMAKTDFVVKQGTSTAAWNSASSSSSNTDEKALANAATAANADKYIPTVGAVESRVNAAVSSGINSIASVTKNATTNQVVTGVTTEAGSVKSVTSSSIKTAMIDDSAITTDKLNSKAVTAAKIADNTITASQIANGTITNTQIANTTITGGKLVNGTITATQLADEAVTIGKIASAAKSTAIPATGAVDTKLATEKAVADAVAAANSDATAKINALDVSDTATNQAVKSVSETDGKIIVSRGTITYKDGLNSTLKQIDSATTDATCSVSSPCILTYTGTDYKWTNMDTAGDSAVADSNS